ncbi:ABC transporter permease [Kribbella sp. NPDC050124]|uniref:ABC transporter permease n=1 Tax=Kribbella sp. NPDC050124 TaxID=3364114 RepID=UPI0037B32487
MTRAIGKLLNSQGRNLGLLTALVVLTAYVTAQRPTFGSFDNWRAILLNASFTAIPALATTVILILGKVDLSIGSIYGFGGILSAWLSVDSGLPWWAAMLVGVLAGALLGLLNGLLVRRIPVSPLIVTLGSLTLIYGANLLMTSGQGIRGIPDTFTKLGQARPLGIPTSVWVWAIAAVATAVLLQAFRVGRHIYAIGGNEQAAATSGINVRAIVLWAFSLNGAFAALGGVLSASRLQSADANLGRGSELSILTAVILGGVAFTGGEGAVLGVVIAVVFLAVIDNALVALSIDPSWSFVVKGTVLIIAVALNQLAIEHRNRRQKAAMLKIETTETKPVEKLAGQGT